MPVKGVTCTRRNSLSNFDRLCNRESAPGMVCAQFAVARPFEDRARAAVDKRETQEVAMKVGYKKLGLVFGAVVALALLPARADAQIVSYSPIFWSMEGGAGIAIPMGDLADASSSGVSFTLGGSYFLNPRLALRAEGGLDLMGEGDAVAIDPDLQIWHFLGGLEYHITDPTGQFLFAVDGMAGGATLDTEFFEIPGTGGGMTTSNLSKTVFALAGGVKLGYNFARHAETGVPIATIFVNGDFHYMFTKEEDTATFADYNGISPFGATYSLPVTAGLRLNIP